MRKRHKFEKRIFGDIGIERISLQSSPCTKDRLSWVLRLWFSSVLFQSNQRHIIYNHFIPKSNIRSLIICIGHSNKHYTKQNLRQTGNIALWRVAVIKEAARIFYFVRNLVTFESNISRHTSLIRQSTTVWLCQLTKFYVIVIIDNIIEYRERCHDLGDHFVSASM